MANLTTKTFTELVRGQVVAIQGTAARLLDLSVGSILRAVVEANAASVGLWLQGLILKLLATTRAATSEGEDLNSWMADFDFDRLPAKAATGDVTFSRFTTTEQAVVPIGATVQTGDGSQGYTVTLDADNANYDAGLGGYVLAIGTPSISVPVKADTAGAAGNAQAGQINVITKSIPRVDTVTNAVTFDNGYDEETGTAFRARFWAYIASLSRGTKAAIIFAITSVQQGVVYKLVENESYAGDEDDGYFYVVVDDGSGTPTTEFIDSINNATDVYRGFTVRFGIFPPVVVAADVAMTATIADGYDAVATKALADEAVTAYIASLAIGETLRYTRLDQVAYNASPGITNISGLTLNGGTSDLPATQKQVIKPNTVVVS